MSVRKSISRYIHSEFLKCRQFDPAKPTANILVLDPHSHYAHSIFELSAWVLYVCLAIFLLVAGWSSTLAGSSVRSGEADPKQVFGSTKWEMVYVIPPTLLLAVIFGFTLHVMHTSDPPAQASGDDIVVVGHQWWWEVRYPKMGFTTANEVHIPTGKNVQFGFESADDPRLLVPELGRKIDMIPGRHRKDLARSRSSRDLSLRPLHRIYYWYPKITGRMLSERLGKWHFWLTVVGFNATFFVQHLLGFRGMTRRVWTFC